MCSPWGTSAASRASRFIRSSTGAARVATASSDRQAEEWSIELAAANLLDLRIPLRDEPLAVGAEFRLDGVMLARIERLPQPRLFEDCLSGNLCLIEGPDLGNGGFLLVGQRPMLDTRGLVAFPQPFHCQFVSGLERFVFSHGN